MPEYEEFNEDVEVIEEAVIEPVEEPVEEPKPSRSRKKVDVDVMPTNLFADVYVVVAEDGAYLVSKTEFEDGLVPGQQKMEKQVLDRAPMAHDFGPELAKLMPTVEDIAKAFYRAGIVDKNTLMQGQRYRNALVRSMPRLNDILSALEG